MAERNTVRSFWPRLIKTNADQEKRIAAQEETIRAQAQAIAEQQKQIGELKARDQAREERLALEHHRREGCAMQSQQDTE